MIVYLNGSLIDHADARISVFDRGFIFGDGVYEGLRAVPDDSLRGGIALARIVGLDLHIERLREGLRDSDIPWDAAELRNVADAVLHANGLRDAFVYLQVTRGVPDWSQNDAIRSRVPTRGARSLTPTVFAYCTPQPSLELLDPARRGMPPCKSVHVLDDIRWSKGRLKSISLMGNVMLSLQAARSRDDDAIFVRTLAAQSASTRLLTEGLATNVILALPDASVVTPSLESVPILAGVTRELVLRAAQAAGMPIEERAVEEHELREASEVMLVGTTTMVTSVTKMDGAPVGRGEHLGVPGPCARKLHRMLFDVLRAGA